MSRTGDLSPALVPLWQALHARLSTGQVVKQVKVGPLDSEQRAALADFLGKERLPGEYVTVVLAQVDAVLREVTGYTAYEVVERLLGPIRDRAAERRTAEVARDQLWAWLSQHEVVGAQPALESWVRSTKKSGLIAGSVERTRVELARALRVLHELPGAGRPLPLFADDVLGDPHDLDEGTRLHTLVVRALSTIYGIDPPTDAGQLRALWARAGVADDELSSTVLTAGLRVHDDASNAVTGLILRACADTGQAAVLTLQQLRASAHLVGVPARVWVVENPSILATALARLGRGCLPMVCTSGWPSSAGVLLLELLAAADVELRYHGDFDGEGLRIAANVIARVGATPWRMTSADYLAAVGPGGPAVGRVTPVPWDPDLAGHMIRGGCAVPEERVADDLIADMTRHQGL
ncbi:TIGR02679 family protein [Nocardia australiensis]|uniref:TIGR02679 family protein n=1 Tax=Nocardia australiensis TaxID=2887191 RepID=UPI001D148C6F|nr:TIGR02679 family protein [Nocardia australiensis]